MLRSWRSATCTSLLQPPASLYSSVSCLQPLPRSAHLLSPLPPPSPCSLLFSVLCFPVLFPFTLHHAPCYGPFHAPCCVPADACSHVAWPLKCATCCLISCSQGSPATTVALHACCACASCNNCREAVNQMLCIPFRDLPAGIPPGFWTHKTTASVVCHTERCPCCFLKL